jgi:excisionase family DNA binding protein
MNENEKLLTEKEAAEYLRSSVHFLRRERAGRNRIRWSKLGKFVRYQKKDLQAYIEANASGGGGK